MCCCDQKRKKWDPLVKYEKLREEVPECRNNPKPHLDLKTSVPREILTLPRDAGILTLPRKSVQSGPITDLDGDIFL